MPLNTCLFNNYPSAATSIQKTSQYISSTPNHSLHRLIYSFIGPIDGHHLQQPRLERGHPKLSQIVSSIMMVKRTQELDSHILIMIDCLCNLKSSPLSNLLYARVSNLLENNIQQSIFSQNVQNLCAKKVFRSLITGERLFRVNSSSALTCTDEEDELTCAKKDELSEDLNEAASTTSGFSREGDICMWSLTTTDLERTPHDASGNYLFPLEDDTTASLKGVMSCYDGFFVGNLEITFDSADQYLSLPMKQIPGKNTPQKQAPKQLVVEKKTVHQIKTQESMFSSPVVQTNTRFDPSEISNPLTPQYTPQKNQRRSPKSNFHKTYSSSTHQSLEKKPPVFQQQQQRPGGSGGISMSLFVNDKLKKIDHGYGRKKSHFTDSQPNSGIAKRS